MSIALTNQVAAVFQKHNFTQEETTLLMSWFGESLKESKMGEFVSKDAYREDQNKVVESINALRVELKGEIQGLRVDMQAMKAEIHKELNNLIFKMLGLNMAVLTVGLTLIKLFKL